MTAAADTDSIGFIGLGAMGMWMAIHLAEKLPPTTRICIFDIVTILMEDFCALYPDKAVRCSSPKDVADQSVCSPRLWPFGFENGISDGWF